VLLRVVNVSWLCQLLSLRLHIVLYKYTFCWMQLRIPTAGNYIQLIVTTLSSRVHSQNRTGALYLIRHSQSFFLWFDVLKNLFFPRIFDFLTTLVVLRLTAMNGSGNRGDTKNRYKLWSLVVWFLFVHMI
jgi:hypothetical protein